MGICYLFSKYLTDEGCLCIKFTENQTIESEPEFRSFQTISLLQKGAKTIVVESCEQASLFTVELPLLSEKKSRAALPYALEDKLAQPLEELHFAFNRQHYHKGSYLVAVIAKQRLIYLMERLTTNNVIFEAITLDWFALQNNEICLIDQMVLLHQEDYKGALSQELASLYSKTTPQAPGATEIKEPYPLWVAKRLGQFSFSQKLPLKSKLTRFLNKNSGNQSQFAQNERIFLDLCQGEFQQKSSFPTLKKNLGLAAGFAAAWLISLILNDVFSIHILNKRIESIDTQIAVIYKEFFPQAKQIISPQFRIQQVLENFSLAQPRFWQLLSILANVLPKDHLVLQQLQFQNNRLAITLSTKDFATLEQIEAQLQKQHIHVQQTQAAAQDERVIAALELS